MRLAAQPSPALTAGTARVYTVSARGKPARTPVLRFLREGFGHIPLARIDSVFGFVERCTLYGGRLFERPQLTDEDVNAMRRFGIGLRLPMTNHTASRREYESYQPLFEKYHARGNSVIATCDSLARWLRQDFPLYQIEASVIKNINSHARIAKAMEIYDTVVLPMEMNQDLGFLEKAEPKSRITLFANAGCALTCPSKTCYASVSKMNKFTGEGEFLCSQPLKERELLGMVDFDLDALAALGYTRFKLLRPRPGGMTGH
jgi:hypothetical protein